MDSVESNEIVRKKNQTRKFRTESRKTAHPMQHITANRAIDEAQINCKIKKMRKNRV